MSDLFHCNNNCLCMGFGKSQKLDYLNCIDITHVVESPVHILLIAWAVTLTSLLWDVMAPSNNFLFQAINLASEYF